MDAQNFQGNCRFFMRGGKLHGACSVRLPNGRIMQIYTKKGEGVDLPRLTYDIAKNQRNKVGGFWGSAWKSAKGAAESVAKGKVTKTLLKKAKGATEDALEFAKTPQAQMALSFVPGGQAIAMGQKAAMLIQQAKAGNRQAKKKIRTIKALAQQGNPKAAIANKVLTNIYRLGKQKNAWLSNNNPFAVNVSGYRYERYPPGGYPVMRIKGAGNALRMFYAMGVNR